MDAVYLYGPGGDDELRHSLRSLVNLRQVDRVVVSGAQPAWLSNDVVRVIPGRHPAGKHHDTWANLRAAVDDPRVSDEFVLMNDDFFVLEQVDSIPVLHAGVLEPRAERSAFQDKRRDTTLDMLGRLDCDARLSYELHVPMVIHKYLMAGLMTAVEAANRRELVWKRTLYGNVAHPGVGDYARDVKVHDFDTVPAPGQVFVSTSDYTFRRAPVGEWLRRRFPKASRYELG
jgi:hypothetical protein